MAELSIVSAATSVLCIAAGGILLSMALGSRPISYIPPAAADLPCLSSVSAVVSGTTATTASTPALMKGSSSVSPSGVLAVPATPKGEGGAVGFRFVRGDPILPREELVKVLALGGRLAKYDHIKVILEGFADEPGTEDKKRLMARRRAGVVRQMFSEKGVVGDHITVVATDVALAPEWAGTVRVRTQPPVPELEAK